MAIIHKEHCHVVEHRKTDYSGLCACVVRHLIVEEDIDHPLIGRPVLDAMSFVASQHLDSVRDKFHLHNFSHIGEELLNMGKQPFGAMSKILLRPADILELIERAECANSGKEKKSEASGADEAKRA
jgi:hypothetical protein